MSGETEKSVSGWTVDTLAAHHLALNEAERRFQAERDLRYTQLREADQRALEIKSAGDREAKRIKEEADSKALTLDRETQAYKDEKANQLREQINRERLLYATKDDVAAAANRLEAIINPLVTFMASQQGEHGGRATMQEMFMKNIPSLILALLSIGAMVVAVAYAIRK